MIITLIIAINVIVITIIFILQLSHILHFTVTLYFDRIICNDKYTKTVLTNKKTADRELVHKKCNQQNLRKGKFGTVRRRIFQLVLFYVILYRISL